MLQVLSYKYGLLVTNKPVGVCSDPHPEDKVDSMVLRVSKFFPGHVNVHRIDKNTSGILVFANLRSMIAGMPAHTWMFRQWHHQIIKTYLAVIPSPKWENCNCSIPLADKPGSQPKTCSTAFKVLARNSDGYALVASMLVDHGRLHQIRKHLKHLGSPIVGDVRYGGRRTKARKGQLLHAWRFGVDLPMGFEEFQAPVPEDFRTFDFDWENIDAGSSTVTNYQ